MSGEALPTFRYHPDPVATGSVVPSEAGCVVCGRPRGFIYTGPVFAVEEYLDEICPWCIADGSAAESLDSTFTDAGSAVPSDVPAEVTQAVAERTPGFMGWQQERWMYHCGDAAAFLGRVGFAELRHVPEALEMVVHENDWLGWPPERSRAHVESLDTEGDATGYLFRCLHCDRHLAYSDRT